MKRKRANLSWPTMANLSLLLAIVLVSLVTSFGGVAPTVRALRDPLAMLALRSPGDRPDGALFDTKPKRVQKVAPKPTSRVLAQTRTRPEPVFLTEPLPPVPFAETPPLIPDTPIEFGPPPTVCCLLVTPFGPITPPDSPPVSPVPEPGTWMMMLLGFFAVGLAVRRTRRGAQADDGSIAPSFR